MAPIANGRVILKSHPNGYPEPGKDLIYDDSQQIDVENVALNGGYLTKTLDLSIDPFLRGLMNPPKKKHYTQMYEIGKTIWGFGIVVVLRSERDDVKVGDHLYSHYMKFEQYSVRNDLERTRVIQNEYDLPWSLFLGPIGMPGKTAHMGWKEYADAREGQTAFITTGAGIVGSTLIQLAKRDGMKVIASAGSADKVKYMKELGADVAFNYKETSTEDILEKEGPVDVYWDNVGGETLDTALAHANNNARFIECGMISEYNQPGQGIKNIRQVLNMSIHMHGFIIINMEHKYNDWFYSTIPKEVISGEIKYREDIHQGLQAAPDVMLAVQKGANTGKAIIHVADK